jgi:hypothetical protein
MVAMTRAVAVLVLTATMLLSSPARAEAGAAWTARLFGGLENGVALGLSSPDRVLGAEVGQSFLPSSQLRSLTEVSLLARTPGPGAWVGGRLGYQLGAFNYASAPRLDVSHTVDAGLAGGLVSAAGHTLTLEVGAERVYRDEPFICCDSVAARHSLGVRAVLGGQLALGPQLGLFARLGVRTADHLLEIGLLPVVSAGVVLKL